MVLNELAKCHTTNISPYDYIVLIFDFKIVLLGDLVKSAYDIDRIHVELVAAVDESYVDGSLIHFDVLGNLPVKFILLSHFIVIFTVK